MADRLIRGELTPWPVRSLERNLVLLAMKRRRGLDGDLAADHRLQALDGIAALDVQMVRRLRMGAYDDLGGRGVPGPRLDLAEDLRGQGGIGLDHSASL